MHTSTIYKNLTDNGVLKKCTFCNRHMRTVSNQLYLLDFRKEWNAKTIEDVRKRFKDNELYELKDNFCQHCSKIH